jgi:hypothetical protein
MRRKRRSEGGAVDTSGEERKRGDRRIGEVERSGEVKLYLNSFSNIISLSCWCCCLNRPVGTTTATTECK